MFGGTFVLTVCPAPFVRFTPREMIPLIIRPAECLQPDRHEVFAVA